MSSNLLLLLSHLFYTLWQVNNTSNDVDSSSFLTLDWMSDYIDDLSVMLLETVSVVIV